MSIERDPPEGEITPQSLVDAWIAYEASRGGPRTPVWASDYLDDLVYKEPETAWPIIVKLVAVSPSDRILASVAAGPLENLLIYHGSQFVDRAVTLAKENARFRKCLRGVWLQASTDGTLQDIEEVIKDEPLW